MHVPIVNFPIICLLLPPISGEGSIGGGVRVRVIIRVGVRARVIIRVGVRVRVIIRVRVGGGGGVYTYM